MSNTPKTPFEAFLDRETAKRQYSWRSTEKLTLEQMLYAWKLIGERLIPKNKKTGKGGYFDVNPTLTEDLCKYILRDPTFSKDLDKGILLIGPSGTGKTKYIEIFCLLMKHVHHIQDDSYTAKQMENLFKLAPESDPVQRLWKSIMSSKLFVFQDIGFESLIVKTYGSEIHIGVDVLEARHIEFTQKGYLTLATSNLLLKSRDAELREETFEGRYGPRIESRMPEMFNVFPLQGDDLRKRK